MKLLNLSIILVSTLSCTPHYGVVPPIGTKALQKSELYARFSVVVWGEVWNQRLELDADAQDLLRGIVEDAARKVLTSSPTSANVLEAEDTLRRFVASIAELNTNTRGLEVTSNIIEAIKRKLCPLYPIC